jgi:hypothetical protein
MNALKEQERHESAINERELIPVCDCQHKLGEGTLLKEKRWNWNEAQTMDEKRGIWMKMRPISIVKTWMKFHTLLP